MAATFTPGETLVRGDLSIFLVDSNTNATDAAEITFALYWVDPGPPETEVLIGSATRIPAHPAVGEYYASLMIPPAATPGNYRIRWTFREFISSPQQQVVQQFQVVLPSSPLVNLQYSVAKQDMINKLRVLLRDNCVGGEATVEVDAEGERLVVSMEDLWEALKDEG
jgi:hypothetical protein